MPGMVPRSDFLVSGTGFRTPHRKPVPWVEHALPLRFGCLGRLVRSITHARQRRARHRGVSSVMRAPRLAWSAAHGSCLWRAPQRACSPFPGSGRAGAAVDSGHGIAPSWFLRNRSIRKRCRTPSACLAAAHLADRRPSRSAFAAWVTSPCVRALVSMPQRESSCLLMVFLCSADRHLMTVQRG